MNYTHNNLLQTKEMNTATAHLSLLMCLLEVYVLFNSWGELIVFFLCFLTLCYFGLQKLRQEFLLHG